MGSSIQTATVCPFSFPGKKRDWRSTSMLSAAFATLGKDGCGGCHDTFRKKQD